MPPELPIYLSGTFRLPVKGVIVPKGGGKNENAFAGTGQSGF